MFRIYRNGQLEYYHAKRTDEEFWEEHWSSSNSQDHLKPQNEFIVDTLFRFNSPGDRILEAGCGSCGFLYPMHCYGYRAVGLDFARKTLQFVKKSRPELRLLVGDLENLPFDDSSFDGYWSIGVIEHFKNGYGQLLDECRRILKIGGVAYISFPYMNLLRKAKGKCGMYDKTEPKENLAFYQYALNHKQVKRTWVNHGFEFLDQRYMFPYKRLQSGIRLLDVLLDPWHHHSRMLIFRKTG
jgi:SAM-dependent methyltransferase